MNMIQILFCNSNAGKRIFSFLGQIMDIIMITVPVILIIIGTIDFIKVIIANKDDEMKKTQNMVVKRLIIALIIFFVPAIVSFLMGLLGEKTGNLCMTCFNDPKLNTCKVTNNVQNSIPIQSIELNTNECKDSVDKNLCCKEKNGPNDADGIWIWSDDFGCKNTTPAN